MDSFCKVIDEYPSFVKQRLLENVTDRVKIWIEEKINQARMNSLQSLEKEELKIVTGLIVELFEDKRRYLNGN